MNYTPFNRDYKAWEYAEKIGKSQGYKGSKPFHGPYASGKPEYILSAPAQGISTKYL